MTLCRSPMLEVRLATYTLFSAVAKSGDISGVQALLLTSGFVEFLLERTESNQDGRLAKFHLVQNVYQVAKGLLSETLVQKFESHLQQGPHYVKPLSWDVAAE